MIHTKSKQRIMLILFVLVMFFFIILYLIESIDYKALAAFLGMVITWYISILKLSIENDRIFRELFIDFNNKYSGKLNDIFNRLRTNSNYQLKSKDKLKIIDYFNLCSEEYLWYERGRVPRKVWEAWEAGILENLSIPTVKQIFIEDTETERKRKSYYGFVEEIMKKI
jgi:hypothetical protein